MLKQKTVYFREEDLAAWDAIPNKAQWLHDKLSEEFTDGAILRVPDIIDERFRTKEGL